MRTPHGLITALVTMFALMGPVLLLADYVSPVIHEPFDMPVGSVVGNNGGAGLGTWGGSGGVVSNATMVYGTLPTKGNKYSGQFQDSWVSFSSTLSSAGLLDHGATLWFSVLLQAASGANDTGFVGLTSGTGNFLNGGTAGSTMTGLRIQNGNDVVVVAYTNQVQTVWQPFKYDLSQVSPTLLVVKCEWGADASSLDTMTVYLPGTDLVQPAPAATKTLGIIDQAAFQYVGINMKNTNFLVDEIRFGKSYEAVLKDYTPPPLAGTVFYFN